jgi:hypothetical protein
VGRSNDSIGFPQYDRNLCALGGDVVLSWSTLTRWFGKAAASVEEHDDTAFDEEAAEKLVRDILRFRDFAMKEKEKTRCQDPLEPLARAHRSTTKA